MGVWKKKNEREIMIDVHDTIAVQSTKEYKAW